MDQPERACQPMNISMDAILNYLSLAPAGGVSNAIIYSIFLYLIFILALITLFLMPDKNLVPTLLTGAVLMAAVLAKLVTAGANVGGFRPEQFGMLIVNVIPFLCPFLVAGMTRTRKRTNPVPPLAILTGLLGGVYMFIYGFFVMRWFVGG
ncbi:MAG: hypothetical protein SF123_21285 [Chloroflexota bacterium]|nr:hypothetical protein [Chloroflexota bacterium]